MIYFHHTEYLLALAAVPLMAVLFFLLVRWKKRAIKKIGDVQLVKQLMGGYSPLLFAVKFLIVSISFILCVIAVADLVKPEGSNMTNRKGIDIIIALDVSNSMLADDIKPNRLERAKQIVGRIIDKLSDNRIGLVIFAGRAYVQMPVTTDHSAAKMYLAAVSPDDIQTQGTVIGQALKTSYAAFNTKEKKYRSIILITDGEDHDKEAIKVSRQLAEDGVMINTIGIGSPQGAPIRDKETNDYKKDDKGNTVVTRLNEEVLKNIAQNGNGLYQLFTSTDEVANNIQNKLAGLGQTTLSDAAFNTYKNYFWYFLLAALLLLIAELFIPETKKATPKSVKKYAARAAAALALLFIANILPAQQVSKQISNGNESYKRNDFDNAASSYQEALAKAPRNNVASFNLGNALFKKEKPEEAIEQYDRAAEFSKDKMFKEKAYYNKGVTFQKQNKLPECISEYKNALKIDPADEDARQNLQRALQQLKQQQQQQNQDEKKQDNKEDQKKQPKPQPSKITKRDAEEKLKSLSEHEKDLQEKLRKVRTASPDQPKIDW